MNFRATLLLLVAAVGLAAFVYFYEVKGSRQRQENREALAKLLPLEADDIERIRVAYSGKNISMIRRSGNWVLIQPVEADCDHEVVQAFLDSLASARREENVGSGDLIRYGLDSPAAIVDIDAAGEERRTHRLRFGRINPLQTLVYMQLDDSKDVLLTSSALLTMALNTEFGWRNKRMIQVDPERVTRMSFRTLRAGSLSVQRHPRMGWVSERDIPWRVDPVRVQSLLLALSDLRAIGIAAEGKEKMEKFGVNSRRFGAVLEFDDGSLAGDLIFGFATSEGESYAIVPDKPEIFQVDGKLTETITAFAHDPRDRSLFPPFQPGSLTRVEVDSPTDQFVIERRSPVRWAVTTSQKHDSTFVLEQTKVAMMLDELTAMKITSFPKAQPDSSYYQPAQISIRLFNEDGLVSGIELGRKDPSGSNTFARGVAEPAVFLLSPAALITLPLDLEKLGVGEVEVPGGIDRG